MIYGYYDMVRQRSVLFNDDRSLIKRIPDGEAFDWGTLERHKVEGKQIVQVAADRGDLTVCICVPQLHHYEENETTRALLT